MGNLTDYENLLEEYANKLKDFYTKEYLITPQWLKDMFIDKREDIIKILSDGNQADSKPANCAIFSVSASLLRSKAKDYAKFKHRDEYNDPIYHRDVLETLNDFEAGYKAALKDCNER